MAAGDCFAMDDGTNEPVSSASPTGEHARPRRRARWIIIAVVALLAIYLLSPYYAFWRFTVALRTGDATQLASSVDFISLRKSLRKQLNAQIASLRPQNPKRQQMFDSLSAAFGGQVVDSLLDAYLTPEGLAAFLADPRLPSQQVAPAAPPDPNAAPVITTETSGSVAVTRRVDWSKVRYAFFTGPRDFLVDVEGTKLRFRFTGLRWQLRAAELDMSQLKI
jgi:hypothetical protein